MVEVPSLLVSIFSLLVNNAEAFVIAPPWADDNANPCSEVSIDLFQMLSYKILQSFFSLLKWNYFKHIMGTLVAGLTASKITPNMLKKQNVTISATFSTHQLFSDVRSSTLRQAFNISC